MRGRHISSARQQPFFPCNFFSVWQSPSTSSTRSWGSGWLQDMWIGHSYILQYLHPIQKGMSQFCFSLTSSCQVKWNMELSQLIRKSPMFDFNSRENMPFFGVAPHCETYPYPVRRNFQQMGWLSPRRSLFRLNQLNKEAIMYALIFWSIWGWKPILPYVWHCLGINTHLPAILWGSQGHQAFYPQPYINNNRVPQEVGSVRWSVDLLELFGHSATFFKKLDRGSVLSCAGWLFQSDTSSILTNWFTDTPSI